MATHVLNVFRLFYYSRIIQHDSDPLTLNPEQPLWQARERPRDRSRGHRSQLSEVTALRVPSLPPSDEIGRDPIHPASYIPDPWDPILPGYPTPESLTHKP